jgi:hypothetical protein
MNNTPNHSPESPRPDFVLPPHWDISSIHHSYRDDLINESETLRVTSQSHDHISYEKPSFETGEVDTFDLIFNREGHCVADRTRYTDEMVHIEIAGEPVIRASMSKGAEHIDMMLLGALMPDDFNQAVYVEEKASIISLSGGVISRPSGIGASLQQPVVFYFDAKALLAGRDIVAALPEFNVAGWDVTPHGTSADYRWPAGDINARIGYQVEGRRMMVSLLDKKTGITKTLDCPAEVDSERVAAVAFAPSPTESDEQLRPPWRDIGGVIGVKLIISQEIQ